MTTYQAISTSLETFNGSNAPSSWQRLPSTDPSRLAPEDAFYAHSPPRRRRDQEAHARVNGEYIDADSTSGKTGVNLRGRRDKDRGRSGSRKDNGVWKKLLWVKQSCMHVLGNQRSAGPNELHRSR